MAEFENMNMMTVNIDQFTRLIREQMEDEDYMPIVGIGKSGVGKTECIKELTDELGIGFCELRLVTLTETDMLGIPTINEHGRTDWASNNLLPDEKRDGYSGVLVLDEITSAVSTVRAAAYQLLDSKRSLGNYKLPEKWLVVALGNGPDDGGVFQGMEAAFLNRCRCLRVEPDFNTWKKWATRKEVNPSVLAYLSFEPQYLHHFNPDSPVGVFPSPRSWTGLSKKLNDRERRNGGKSLNPEDLDIYAASAVGQEVALKFSAFYAYNKKVIAPEDILGGKATGDVGYEMQVLHLAIQNLVRILGKELKESKANHGNYSKEVMVRTGNACNWLIDISKTSLDMSVMAIRDLVNTVKGFDEILMSDNFDTICPRFPEFAQRQGVMLR